MEIVTKSNGTKFLSKVINKFSEVQNKTIQNILHQRRSAFKYHPSIETISRIKGEVAMELRIAETTEEERKENNESFIQEMQTPKVTQENARG